jgi:hypothetical protein
MAEREDGQSENMSRRVNSAFAKALVGSLALGCGENPPARALIVDTPRIERRPEGPVLVLTDEMERALRAAVPNFRHTPLSEYIAEIRQAAPPTDTTAPFAAIGDFNGDKRQDVVVHGRDSTRGFVLMLVTEADSVRVITVGERLLVPGESGAPQDGFVSLVRQGVVEADTTADEEYSRVPVRLEHDAFELVAWEKAAIFYYWRDGRFVKWITSD